MDANDSSGLSGRPGGSSGFSRNRAMRPPASASMIPKALASRRGTRMPAIVASMPEAMWVLTMSSTFIR